MLRHAVRPLLRVALLSLLFSFLPPASQSIVRAAAPLPAEAVAVDAKASVTPHPVAHMVLASQPAPSPNVTPSSRPASAPIGQLSAAAGASAILLPTWDASPGGVWYYTSGAGWKLKRTGLPSGWRWLGITVDKFDSRIWYLWGNTSGGSYSIAGGMVVAMARNQPSGDRRITVTIGRQ